MFKFLDFPIHKQLNPLISKLLDLFIFKFPNAQIWNFSNFCVSEYFNFENVKILNVPLIPYWGLPGAKTFTRRKLQRI